jgi:hypothetical protein
MNKKEQTNVKKEEARIMLQMQNEKSGSQLTKW